MISKFEPTEQEVSYIKKLKETRAKKSGISKSGQSFLLCSMPYKVWARQQLLWTGKGNKGSWTYNDNVLAKFLAKNPQYKIGNPTF